MFKNIKEAHEHYNYPGSYRTGTIYNDKGVIRCYSNGMKDIYKNKVFYYELKNNKIKDMFRITKENKKKVRIFRKEKDFVKDLGLYKVDKFYKNYVKLIK